MVALALPVLLIELWLCTFVSLAIVLRVSKKEHVKPMENGLIKNLPVEVSTESIV